MYEDGRIMKTLLLLLMIVSLSFGSKEPLLWNTPLANKKFTPQTKECYSAIVNYQKQLDFMSKKDYKGKTDNKKLILDSRILYIYITRLETLCKNEKDYLIIEDRVNSIKESTRLMIERLLVAKKEEIKESITEQKSKSLEENNNSINDVLSYGSRATSVTQEEVKEKKTIDMYRRTVTKNNDDTIGLILYIFFAIVAFVIFIIRKHMNSFDNIASRASQKAKEVRRQKEEVSKQQAKERMNQLRKQKEDIRKKQAKYISSISTNNPIKWAKYTSLIAKAEDKFIDIYNFQTPQENKEIKFIIPLAYTVLFEEARLNRLNPDEFLELLVGFGGDTEFRMLIKPVNNSLFDFELFKNMYILYIDFRARRIRPIISMMSAMQSLESSITKEEINILLSEYEHNPMFGTSV